MNSPGISSGQPRVVQVVLAELLVQPVRVLLLLQAPVLEQLSVQQVEQQSWHLQWQQQQLAPLPSVPEYPTHIRSVNARHTRPHIGTYIHQILHRTIRIVVARLQRTNDLFSFKAHLYHILDRRLKS